MSGKIRSGSCPITSWLASYQRADAAKIWAPDACAGRKSAAIDHRLSPVRTSTTSAPAVSKGSADGPDRPSGRSGPSALPFETAGADVVEVRTGDSLWSIAADFLPAQASGAQIFAASARWYEANRDVIGHDPDLIFPDMVLHAPQPEES